MSGKKPKTYKVLSISIYHEDLEILDRLVAEARRQGKRSMSRSKYLRTLVRAASKEGWE